MPHTRSSIRARLITLIVSVTLPLLIALAVLFVWQVQRDTLEARDLAHRIAHSIASDLHDSVEHSRSLLERMAARPRIAAARAGDCDVLFPVVDFFPEYVALQLFDLRGNLVCSSVPTGRAAADAAVARQWTTRFLQSSQPLPEDPVLVEVGGRWISVMFKAVREGAARTGTLALYQYVDFNLDAYPRGTVVTIIDRASRVVARSTDPEKWMGRVVTANVVRNVLQRGDGSIEAAGLDGQLREYGFTPVVGTRWHLYVGISARVAMAAVRALVIRNVIIGLILIALVVALASRMARAIERPLDHLARAARQVTEKGYSGSIAIEGPREIATVADAFNTMVARRGEAEAALTHSREQLQALSKRLLEAQEEERTHIAREIHDELGQLLTALNMDVVGLLDATGPLPPSKEAMAERIRRVLADTLTSVQRISSELRPPMLDDFGLLAAIESYVRAFEERTGIECELSVPPELPRLSREAETGVYRILQESMTNIARHSNARRAEVRVRVRPDAVLLDVRDDGRGITPAELTARGALGIAGMRERAGRIDATVDIQGIDGNGTIVSVRLPRQPTEGAES